MKKWLALPRKLKTFFKKRSKGSAMAFSITIALMNFFIILAVLLKVSYKSHELDMYKVSLQLSEMVRSASMIMEESPDLFVEGNNIHDFFKNELPEYGLEVNMTRWGFYYVAQVRASFKNLNHEKVFLYSDDILSLKNAPSLYLSARKTYLSLSGNSYLGPNCFLPEYGVRSANFGGKSYTRSEYIHGNSFRARDELPEINQDIKRLATQLKIVNNLSDSLIDVNLLNSKFIFINSFKNKTLICYSNKSIVLDNLIFKGNIKIISDKSILIKNTSKLSNIIVVAPIINIEAGFSGNAQFFATDRIDCGEKCNFQVPTVFVLDNKKESDQISIGDDTYFYGDIMILNNIKRKTAAIRINRGSKMIGQLYCNGYLTFEATLFGSLYTRGILKNTPSGLRLNVLEDVCVDISRMPVEYGGTSLIEANCNKKLCDVLF